MSDDDETIDPAGVSEEFARALGKSISDVNKSGHRSEMVDIGVTLDEAKLMNNSMFGTIIEGMVERGHEKEVVELGEKALLQLASFTFCALEIALATGVNLERLRWNAYEEAHGR